MPCFGVCFLSLCMKYSIQHRTAYTYSAPVRDSFNDARLCPVSDDFQRCEQFDLTVAPVARSIFRRLDFYLNQVHHFEVIEPHERLQIVSRSIVETFADTRNLTVPSSPEHLLGLGRDERFYDYLCASERVELVPMVIHEARELVPFITDVRRSVEHVMASIYQSFTYASGTTVVETSVVDVMKHRSGVCQDFAHVMIAFCRALGIPARYVSGYFYIDKSCFANSADDNSASHAWVECYLPKIGWVGYDPTHNRRVSEIYIKVAVGRDYSDVRPISGSYLGNAVAELEVAVAVERVE